MLYDYSLSYSHALPYLADECSFNLTRYEIETVNVHKTGISRSLRSQLGVHRKTAMIVVRLQYILDALSFLMPYLELEYSRNLR